MKEQYTCEICGKSFSTEKALRMHRLGAHHNSPSDNSAEDTELESLTILAEVQKIVAKHTEEVENRLASKLNELVGNLYAKVAEDAKTAREAQTEQVKAALMTVPNLIQEQVQAQLQANLNTITEQVAHQFETKLGQVGQPATAGSITSLLTHPDGVKAICEVINTIRQPTGEQQLAQVFRTFIQGMQMGQKLKSGEVTPSDMEKVFGITNPAVEKQG